MAQKQSAAKFINSLETLDVRRDCRTLVKIMKDATGKPARMWGTSIVGFDTYQYASGREGDCFITGFSPQKTKLSLYIMPGFDDYQKEVTDLGKHKTGVSCLYIKNLASIDITVLEKIIHKSVEKMREIYSQILVSIL